MPRQRRGSTPQPQAGGFMPSIMEGFCSAASQYVAPIALFILHRMIRGGVGANTKKVRRGHQKR